MKFTLALFVLMLLGGMLLAPTKSKAFSTVHTTLVSSQCVHVADHVELDGIWQDAIHFQYTDKFISTPGWICAGETAVAGPKSCRPGICCHWQITTINNTADFDTVTGRPVTATFTHGVCTDESCP